MLNFAKGVWYFCWAMIAWIPLFILCALAVIATFDTKEFKRNLDNYI